MSFLFVCLIVFFGGEGYAFVSEVAEERISQICVLSNPPSSLDGVFPTLPRMLCLTQVPFIIEISSHPKLVSVPFSSLHFVIGHLEKCFRRESCKALRRDKVNTIRRRSPSSNIVLYSRFIWVNGSITQIRAEIERYDVVRFSEVTAKSLASGTGF